MTDIVKRLREWAGPFPTGVDAPLLGSDLHKAADEIERLRASLQAFVTFHSGHVLPPELVNAMLLAREALGDGIERSGR